MQNKRHYRKKPKETEYPVKTKEKSKGKPWDPGSSGFFRLWFTVV